MDTNSPWYLLKNEDGTVFGPVAIKQLQEWAAAAQISPLDKISQDQSEWNRAPTCPDLHMDWLVQPSPGQLYGPTTVGALREFIFAGEIDGSSAAINCVEARQCQVRDIPELEEDLQALEKSDNAPGRASVRETLKKRVNELEQLLIAERDKHAETRRQLAQLTARYIAATGNQP